MRFRLMAGTVFSTVTLALGAGAAFAQSALAPEAASDDPRDQVTITATRIEQRVDEVPATVSVITAKQIEDELVTDIKDLVRFEPGVSVRSSPPASALRSVRRAVTGMPASTFAALKATVC